MQPLFKAKEKTSVGLDIGTAMIKTVKLKFSKDNPELCSFDLAPIEDDLKPVLKRIAESYDAKKLNLSISGPATIIRYVALPRMNNDELKQALKFETANLIPFPLNEINLDSYILKQDLPDNKMLVLLAAAKKEFISQRLKLIEEAGLKANVIDIDSIAVINAFDFNYSTESNNFKNKAIALLNIGAAITNLNILEDGIPRLSRDIPIAGNNFTQRFKDAFGLSLQSAEELKLNPVQEKAKEIGAAMESVLTNLVAEIRTSFDYYESQSASCVVKIFLSGGGSKFADLKDMLANLIGLEVEHWDPLRQISIPNNIDLEKLRGISGQLAVAVGLALKQ